MTYRVYISSSLRDLKVHRQLVRDAVIKMGMLPIMEENFQVTDENLLTYLCKQIRQSDIFIGIYTHYYGWHPENSDIGGIEIEYNTAREHNLLCLLFILRADAPWPAQFVERGDGAYKLERFKERMLHDATVNFFSRPYELQAQVFFGLQQVLASQNEREGIITIQPLFGRPSPRSQFSCDVFMIMPFSPEFQPIYTDHIVPVADELKLAIKRGDNFYSEHAIMAEVWSAIYASRVVIAECTGRNPNVFYELGIAHTLGKPAIMLTQDIEDVPFDLRHLRVIVYENTPEGLRTLRHQLSTAITRLL
ncbi:MAG: DUF4062 domain-containing protein [Chloroflexi bacterium]|nr:DUF4062 domain-containing protein [Chloroflexota bacterium]MDL1885125.1 DUF4062 domain-containing protein [Anaerolineae bacterium CFX8]